MKKKTISAILLAFNICMVIAIIFLVVKINMRGPKPDDDPLLIADNESSVSEMAAVEDEVDSDKEARTDRLIVIPNTTNSVNVRSGPGTDYNRVGSAYADCEYDVIEIYNDEWTKIDYDGEYGYIYNEYIVYKYKMDFEDGTSSYSDVPVEDLEQYKKKDASDVYINTDAIENDTDNQNAQEEQNTEDNNSEEQNN